jgi:hypothetical protein
MGVVAVATTMVALAITPTASAAGTRVEYVAQVNPICQAQHNQAKTAHRSYKKRIRPFIKRGIEPLPKAAVRIYLRYQREIVRLRRTADAQILAVPPAPTDRSTVSEWLRLRGAATDFVERSARAVAHGNSRWAGQLLTKANDREFKAELLVQDFGLDACTPFLSND